MCFRNFHIHTLIGSLTARKYYAVLCFITCSCIFYVLFVSATLAGNLMEANGQQSVIYTTTFANQGAVSASYIHVNTQKMKLLVVYSYMSVCYEDCTERVGVLLKKP